MENGKFVFLDTQHTRDTKKKSHLGGSGPGRLNCVLFCSMLGRCSYVLCAAVRRLRLTVDESAG